MGPSLVLGQLRQEQGMLLLPMQIVHLAVAQLPLSVQHAMLLLPIQHGSAAAAVAAAAAAADHNCMQFLPSQYGGCGLVADA